MGLMGGTEQVGEEKGLKEYQVMDFYFTASPCQVKLPHQRWGDSVTSCYVGHGSLDLALEALVGILAMPLTSYALQPSSLILTSLSAYHSTAQDGVNSNDIFTCLAGDTSSRNSHVVAMKWHLNPRHLTPCFLVHTRHCVGQ